MGQVLVLELIFPEVPLFKMYKQELPTARIEMWKIKMTVGLKLLF